MILKFNWHEALRNGGLQNLYKNSTEVDIAPASGKVSGPLNIGQGHRVKVRA